MKKVTFLFIIIVLSQLSFGQGEWLWSNQLKSAGDVYPSANIVMDIQADDQNNVYHCGGFDSSPLTIQSTEILNEARWDAFVCKFDPDGNLLWLNRMYGAHNDEAAAMVIVDGFVYVAGSYKNVSINFSPTVSLPNSGDYDSYLAKYDLDGNLLKATQLFSGSGVNRVKDMTYDPYRKELVITGFFKTEISYNDGAGLTTIPTAENGKDMFFAQVDTSGVINGFNTAYTMQDNNGTVIKDINMSPDSSYYLSGDLFDTLVFPGTFNDTLIGSTSSQALIIKLDKSLNNVWLRTGGGAGSDHANSATSDGFGNVYIAGKVEGNVTFDSTNVLSSSVKSGAGLSDLFILKYNTNGRLLWFNRKGRNGSDNAYGLDIYSNIIQFCGNFADTLIINTDTLTSNGDTDRNTSFALFDTDGNEIGAKGIGGDGEDIGRAVRFDNEGRTLIAGYFTSTTLSIGDSLYTNTTAGLRDGFIASYYYPFRVTLTQTKDILCNNDSTAELVGGMYFGDGQYTYEWSDNVVNFVDSVAYDLPAGSYTLTVTDGRDSVAQVTYVIEEPVAIEIDLDSTNVSCYLAGDGTITTSVSGGIAPYTYEWVGASGYNPTSQNQSGLSAGWFYTRITDNNGCQVTDSIEVLQPEKISSQAAVTPENPGSSDGAIDLTVSGGTSPFNYTWDFEGSPIAGTTPNLTSLEEGKYTAHIVDDNTCTYDTNIVVPGVDLRVVLNGNNISCWKADDGSLEATIASGYDVANTYTFEFQDELKNTLYSGPNSAIADLTPGKYYVILTESPTAESSTDSLTIAEPDSLAITFDPINALCSSGPTVLGTTISGGTPEYSFFWSNGSTSQSLVNVPAGKYILTVTDANYCQTIDSATTTQPDTLLVNIIESVPISCFGYVDGQLNAEVTGGTSPYSYQWNDNGRQTTSFAKLLPADSYDVQVTDDNGCIQIESYQLNGPPVLQLNDVDTSNISCVGSTDGVFGIFMQGGTPPYVYNWQVIPVGDTNYATDLYPGTYYVEVSDSRRCGDSSYSYTVKAPAIALSVSEDATAHEDNICFDGNIGSFTVLPTGGWGNYQYSVNLIDWQSSPVFSDLLANDYTLSVRDNEGCIETENISITQPGELFFSLSQADGTSILVDGSGGTPPYEFSLDQTNWQTEKVFTDLSPGDYYAYLIDANNCGPDTSDVITIKTNSVEDLESAIAKIYPNPSKGILFVEIAAPYNGEFHVEVYSLTGVRVFEETQMVYSDKKHPVKIDISDQSKGIYLLKVNGIVLTTKIILE